MKLSCCSTIAYKYVTHGTVIAVVQDSSYLANQHPKYERGIGGPDVQELPIQRALPSRRYDRLSLQVVILTASSN